MFGSKIKVSKDLLERCKRHAAEMGYSSVEEFVAHTLEKELRNVQQRTANERNDIMKKLKGLGYVE